ncbi:glycosyltransferase family 39 protein [bacterium]|nr:glycosyltransferase family 39 protein [bacterium]
MDPLFEQTAPRPRLAVGLLLALAGAKLALHLASNAWLHYEYFCDEFYYLACAERLAWGYVDHPPLAPFLLSISRALFGDSIFALRLLPALAGGATVLLAGVLARELGGGRKAQALAALATLAAPVLLSIDSIYSMNAFRPLFWSGAFILTARIINSGEGRWWLWLGVLLGVGLLNKVSLLWFGGGLAAALLLTGQRRWLLRPGPWLCAGIALLIFLPHLLWQAAHDWPTLEFMHNATHYKMKAVSLTEFVSQQVLAMNPLLPPLWLGGLFSLLVSRRGRRYSPLGIIFLAVFGLLAWEGKSRPDYIAPAYAVLAAAGAIWFEGLAGTRRWLTGLAFTAVALSGLALAPLAMPILPVEAYLSYAGVLGIKPETSENKSLGALPQFFADMHGWQERVDCIARAYENLTESDKADCLIGCPDYGIAGAVDFLGRRQGLPPAVSGHNNYFLWGLPPRCTGNVLLALDNSPEHLEKLYRQVLLVGRCESRWGMPYRNQNLYLCRSPRLSLREVWPGIKHYD